MALVCFAVPARGIWSWVWVSLLVGVTLLTIGQSGCVAGVIGWSLGRAFCGIAVVAPTGPPLGMGRLLLRDLAHLLDTVSVFVGWLWPLWDPRRRTFADLLLRTEVQCVEQIGGRAIYGAGPRRRCS